MIDMKKWWFSMELLNEKYFLEVYHLLFDFVVVFLFGDGKICVVFKVCSLFEREKFL